MVVVDFFAASSKPAWIPSTDEHHGKPPQHGNYELAHGQRDSGRMKFINMTIPATPQTAAEMPIA